eukprot:2163755-Pyramimonas_sp.AAC.1
MAEAVRQLNKAMKTDATCQRFADAKTTDEIRTIIVDACGDAINSVVDLNIFNFFNAIRKMAEWVADSSSPAVRRAATQIRGPRAAWPSESKSY